MILSRVILTAWLAGVVFAGAAPAEPHWPSWRGPDGTGVAAGDPPVTWSESENILWKVPLAGIGQSTPVVWGIGFTCWRRPGGTSRRASDVRPRPISPGARTPTAGRSRV